MADDETLFEDSAKLNVKLIAGVANQILTTLLRMDLPPLTIHSILTTAFVNHMKNMLRDSPVDYFDENKTTAIALLTQLTRDVVEMRPKEEDARNSKTGENPPKPDGAIH